MNFARAILILFIATSFGCALGADKANREQRAELHFQMATSLMATGKLPEALSELMIAEQYNPNHPEIQNSMGLVYQLRGRPAEAEKRFKRALQLQPKFTEVRTNLARLYIDNNRYNDAIKELKIVEEDLTYSNPEKALILRGMAHFKKGEFDKAEPILNKALQSQRESCLGAYFLGRTYYQKKRFREAAQVLDQSIQNCKSAKFEEPLFYSSMTYYELGEKMEAKARAEELINEYPKSPMVEKAKALIKILDGV